MKDPQSMQFFKPAEIKSIYLPGYMWKIFGTISCCVKVWKTGH